ncbi:hypothetical protein G5C51_22205 [Streptomyces sp. A7024]|uniref:Uncharacterized protein n=1 Tax=Streptomyces coryli TaxID=1128680 RepID=A0A6G4U3E7_9ACTN|nr:hypothetical protein [Streptomyces coryli]NGN66603.1 hypothetical protein [Streptomyces coryli]
MPGRAPTPRSGAAGGFGVAGPRSEEFAYGFHEATEAGLGGRYWATRTQDRHRLAELDADIDGRPYETADPAWLMGKGLSAAALKDPELLRVRVAMAAVLTTAREAFADEALRGRVLAAGGGRGKPVRSRSPVSV